ASTSGLASDSPSRPDNGHVRPARRVARRLAFLFHAPNPPITVQSRAGQQEGTAPITLVHSIQRLHQPGAFGFTQPGRVLLQSQFTLVNIGIVQGQEHHPSLRIAVTPARANWNAQRIELMWPTQWPGAT